MWGGGAAGAASATAAAAAAFFRVFLVVAAALLVPTSAALELRCPSGADAAGAVQLPETRTYHLRAEAKSGTTWLQVMVFQMLDSICSVYNDNVEGVSCRSVCEADREDTCENHRLQCPYQSTTICRTLRVTFTDERGGGEPEKRSVRVMTGSKHAIPFVSASEHPNKTPVLRGVPDWLEDCILNGEFKCLPPNAALNAPFGMNTSAAADLLQPLYSKSTRPLKIVRIATAEGHAEDIGPQGIITIARDPRSVTTSAAHYVPGVNLFGHATFNEPESVNTFVQGTINMTTAWTQFRSFWFGALNDQGLPVFQTFYEDLVEDTIPEMMRMAEFFGLCYTDDVISNVTHKNTQDYYKSKGISDIQHVTMVRSHNRPQDVVAGFLKELTSDTLRVANNTMIMTLEPELLERWMGEDYIEGALHKWDSAHNAPPSIILKLRDCCGDGTIDTRSNNRWRSGQCLGPLDSSTRPSRGNKRTSAGTESDGADTAGRGEGALRKSRSRGANSAGEQRSAAALAGGAFRSDDGTINESRLQQWLLNGLNFLSESVRAKIFPGKVGSVSTSLGDVSRGPHAAAALASALAEESEVRLRRQLDDSWKEHAGAVWGDVEEVAVESNSRRLPAKKNAACTPLRHLL